MKGKKNGKCNRSCCLSPVDVVFYNKGSRAYYCPECAMIINDSNKNFSEIITRYEGGLLCRTDEGVAPRDFRYEKLRKEILGSEDVD